MDWAEIDWQALARLREAYLRGSAGQNDYWRSESDLASYDLTYAQRIGWKWDYVFAQLPLRHWTPPPGSVLDWGCGSGVAGRAFLDNYGTQNVSRLELWDRSPLARQYATRRAQERFPGLTVVEQKTGASIAETIVLSHVLTELSDSETEQLLNGLRSSTAVLWVEPGNFEAARRLSAVRDRLRDTFNVAAPCTHRGDCPMFAQGNESHWCHHFATPPAAVYTDGNWARFGALAGVDLRSLPLSYLVLDQRPLPALDDAAIRIVGRPRVYKAHAQLLACGPDGLHERRLSKRQHPLEFRQLKKEETPAVQVWRCAEDEIIEIRDPSAKPTKIDR